MRQRVDYCYCWLTIVLTYLTLSLINATEQLNSDDSKKELLAKTQSNSRSDVISETDLNNRVNKRASFMPSRGKKEEIDEFGPNIKKASSFMPMRGRKDYYDNQQNSWRVPNMDYGFGNDNDKRAGFMPMRGRKNGYNSDDNEEDVYQSELDSVKRSSFMPMRGRKYDTSRDLTNANQYGQQEYPMAQPYYPSLQIGRPNWMEGQHFSDDNQDMEKKANAFFAGRGKRSTNADVAHINHVKDEGSITSGHHESHNENFFATRG